MNVEIIQDVLDELRRERKTKMVLADADIEEYIDLDLVEGENLDEKEQTPFLKDVLAKKKAFKQEMCQTVSILKLGYMYRVLQQVHGSKASLLSADAFEYKVKKIERETNKGKDAMRKTLQGTGVSGIFSQENIEVDAKALMKAEMTELKDPLLMQIQTFIFDIKQKIKDKGEVQLKELDTKLKSIVKKPDSQYEYMDTIEKQLTKLESRRMK